MISFEAQRTFFQGHFPMNTPRIFVALFYNLYLCKPYLKI